MLLKLVYDTDHAEADALPCVMLLSGADCPHESYMWLAARLAEAGCAVALSSCVVPFGPGTCILSTPFDLSALGSLESYMRNPARAGLEALRAALASFETPRLDLSRLAVGGHSSGGRTALDVDAAQPDRRMRIGGVLHHRDGRRQLVGLRADCPHHSGRSARAGRRRLLAAYWQRVEIAKRRGGEDVANGR